MRNVVGSRGLKDFDPVLVSYAGATAFAAFGLGYRYAMWLRRPPTRLYWFRGWQIFLRPSKLPANIVRLVRILIDNIVLQRFIEKRSKMRWTAHWFLAWGCLLAAAVTFPLSFGWIRFETASDSQEIYNAFVFGIPAGSFHLGTPIATLAFNVLDIAAVMVLIGENVGSGEHQLPAACTRNRASLEGCRQLHCDDQPCCRNRIGREGCGYAMITGQGNGQGGREQG
jgi:hypothetical protein